MAIRIYNTFTNIVGRTKTERLVSREIWKNEIQPALSGLLSGCEFKHRAKIGNWVVSVLGNDAHMHEFFVKNWKPDTGSCEPDVRCLVYTGLRDKAVMMRLLGLDSQEDLIRHRDAFLKALQDKKFKSGLRSPKLAKFDELSDQEQIEEALFAPATVYCAEEFIFLTLNTNYYGQLKSKSSLGPLEEKLIRRAKCNAKGGIDNPEEVWLSMHAGCLEYVTAKRERRGIVMIAPTGTGKSTHGYGLVNAKKENRLHSDDWSFVNIGTREVIASENHYYMRTNIAGLFPHLIPLLTVQPLENVAFTAEMVARLESFNSAEDLKNAIHDGRLPRDEYQKLIEQMVENNSARSLIDPRIMVGDEKFTETAKLTDLLLMKRDYDSPLFLRRIDAEELIEIMTSKDNVFNYAYGKEDHDGYGIPAARTTEIYYNPYLCDCRVDRERGIIGPLDEIRIAAYRHLVEGSNVKAAWVNTRLPANQTQFCLRKYFEEPIDEIRVEKRLADSPLLSALKISIKPKPELPGRREMDMTGFFDVLGREVELIGFYYGGQMLQAAALMKPFQEGKLCSGTPEFAGYAELINGIWKNYSKEEFIKRHQSVGIMDILKF